ncbi:MAG: SDR family NAD(P)-dependent oxidoreductase [Solirubrobacterales bacterium]
MELGLRDKCVLISGSSRGIGLAIGEAFLNEGARVLLTARDGAALNSVRERLAAQFGPDRINTFCGDLTRPEEIQAAVKHINREFGRLDTVIANLGSGTARSGYELNHDDWTAALNLNLVGSMLLASHAVPAITTPGGSITFIASIAGSESINAPIPYGAAKAALMHGMKSLARMIGPKGIRVNAVVPGNILFSGGSWEQKLREREAVITSYIQSEVPLQRFGKPEEIADAVAFLASERAGFITGSCLVVDGGQTRSY